MYISYSGYTKYKKCPRSYWYEYVSKPPAPQTNQLGTLYGSSVGYVFEKFYAEHLWCHQNYRARLDAFVEVAVGKAIQNALRQGVINWDEPKAQFRSRDALVAGVRESIPRGIKIITQHNLIGKDAAAEVVLDSLTQGHKLGGRADFILTRVPPYNDLCLLDGKGGRWRDKYVEQTQLRWYAMLYEMKYGRLPDKLGFIFWQFEAQEAVDWISLQPEDTAHMRELAIDTIDKIEAGKVQVNKNAGNAAVLNEHFPALSGDQCRLCKYAKICPAGMALAEQKKVPLPEASGVHDIGLD